MLRLLYVKKIMKVNNSLVCIG